MYEKFKKYDIKCYITINRTQKLRNFLPRDVAVFLKKMAWPVGDVSTGWNRAKITQSSNQI